MKVEDRSCLKHHGSKQSIFGSHVSFLWPGDQLSIKLAASCCSTWNVFEIAERKVSHSWPTNCEQEILGRKGHDKRGTKNN
jgi:hypothetical protein